MSQSIAAHLSGTNIGGGASNEPGKVDDGDDLPEPEIPL
jgi:hypothetical protein